MSRKSQETIGPNVDIPATTESNAFQRQRLLLPSKRAEERGIVSRKRMIRRCRSIPSSNRLVHEFLAYSQRCIGSELSNRRKYVRVEDSDRRGSIAWYWCGFGLGIPVAGLHRGRRPGTHATT